MFPVEHLRLGFRQVRFTCSDGEFTYRRHPVLMRPLLSVACPQVVRSLGVVSHGKGLYRYPSHEACLVRERTTMGSKAVRRTLDKGWPFGRALLQRFVLRRPPRISVVLAFLGRWRKAMMERRGVAYILCPRGLANPE